MQVDDNELEVDYKNAWEALGGQPSLEGTISRSKMVKVLNEEFEMCEIDEWLSETGLLGEEEINFIVFKQLFEEETVNPERAEKMRSSLVSSASYLNDDEQNMLLFDDWY